MRNEHNESGHNESTSEDYQDADTLELKSVQASDIPPRASAHPSALAAVRPKYPRGVSDQDRVTPFDGITSTPIEIARLAQRQTDDIRTGPLFRNVGDITPIDEIETRPPDVPARLHTRSTKAAHEPVSQADTSPTAVQGKPAEVYPPVDTQSWEEIPDDISQVAQPQGFSLEHYVDNVRWWLLFPGRLEFLFWLIGAIVLVFLTSFFLLVITIWIR